jgi:hypothetical protein
MSADLEALDHGIKAEATMMAVAVHPRDEPSLRRLALRSAVRHRGWRPTWYEHRLPEGARDLARSPAAEPSGSSKTRASRTRRRTEDAGYGRRTSWRLPPAPATSAVSATGLGC